jgi:hypothetical protein
VGSDGHRVHIVMVGWDWTPRQRNPETGEVRIGGRWYGPDEVEDALAERDDERERAARAHRETEKERRS